MAIRSWVKLLATTATAAAVVGAGQLGIAYGLGIVRLDRVLDVTARDQWTAQLAWVAWITMTAAALGAIVATGLLPRWRDRPIGTGGALALGLAGGLGSLAVLPLTMQPARDAQVSGVQPVLVIGIAAGLGAAAGIFAGWASAAKPAARWNLATLTVVMWIVALVSVGPSLRPGQNAVEVRLGVLSGSLIPSAIASHTAFLTMPTLALIAGLVIGFLARGSRISALGAGFSGLAGPALLTVAYLVAGPELGAAGFQDDPYWSAMTACGAGVLGSVLAALVRGAPDATPANTSPAPAIAAAPPAEPATAPLPKRDSPAQSAIAQAAAAAALRPEDELRPSDTGVIAPGTPNNPFAGGSGSPFRAGVPFPPQPAPMQQTPMQPSPIQPPPHAPAPENPPRFSGQQPNPGGRPGRRPAGPPTQGQAGDGFDGFAAGRAGAITAEQPRVPMPRGPVVEPTSISGPYPSGPARKPGQENDYVDWVNGLGGQ